MACHSLSNNSIGDDTTALRTNMTLNEIVYVRFILVLLKWRADLPQASQVCVGSESWRELLCPFIADQVVIDSVGATNSSKVQKKPQLRHQSRRGKRAPNVERFLI
jgi:hypothetical protein